MAIHLFLSRIQNSQPDLPWSFFISWLLHRLQMHDLTWLILCEEWTGNTLFQRMQLQMCHVTLSRCMRQTESRMDERKRWLPSRHKGAFPEDRNIVLNKLLKWTDTFCDWHRQRSGSSPNSALYSGQRLSSPRRGYPDPVPRRGYWAVSMNIFFSLYLRWICCMLVIHEWFVFENDIGYG